MTLLAVPNVSEGRDLAALDAIGAAFEAGGARLLDRHEDPDHHRAVFTLAGEPGALAQAVLAGAREAIARIDLTAPRGRAPARRRDRRRADRVPRRRFTWRRGARRRSCSPTLLGREGLPVYLYGALAGGRTRAELRRGGPEALIGRAPARLRAGRGCIRRRARCWCRRASRWWRSTSSSRAPATLEDARAIAALIREGGAEGLPGVRAIGVQLAHAAQVSTNVEDHRAATPADVVAAVRRHAPVAAAELVALAPEAALRGLPEDVPLRGRATIEERLGAGPR